MTVVNAWVGAATSSSAQVVAKLSVGAVNAWILTDTDVDLSAPVVSGTAPVLERIARLTAAGLEPDSVYGWAVLDDAGGLDLPGGTGNYSSTPDDASLDITGDLDLRVDVSNWTVASEQSLLGKYSTTGNQRSYLLSRLSTGHIQLRWSTDGTSGSTTVVPSTEVVTPDPVTDRVAVRATLDVDDGGDHTVTFYSAPSIAGPWTQLGDPITDAGTTSIHSGTAPLAVGAHQNGASFITTGFVHAAEVRDGIDGTIVARPLFYAETESGFVDEAGRTWTVHGTAALVDGGPDLDLTGRLRTHPAPGSLASFTFWASGDAGLSPDTPGEGDVLAASRLSNHQVFETIHSRALTDNWLFGVHLGDLHYYDLGSGSHGIAGGASLANYRRAYDDVLAQPRQHDLYRHVPTVVLWDDHDYGPNDSDRTHLGRANAQAAFRERVPHYALADPEGIWQTWQVGRVMFIASDVRSYRDPNATPQSSSKTLLGEAQKQWLTDLLTGDTSAQVLVWLCPERAWHIPDVPSGSSADHWGNFPQERAELAQLFTSTGWAPRMVYIGADAHEMALDSGASNPHGGFPVFSLSALDASPAGLTPPQIWDAGGPSTARAQYGTITVTDLGDTIDITATGWIGTQQAMQHTHRVQLVTPPPIPQPEPPQVAVARIRRRVTWLGVHAVTGRIIAELPDVHGEVGRLLSAYDSAKLTIPMPLAGPGHVPIRLLEQATSEKTGAIVAVVNDLPVWMGVVLQRRGGTGAQLELAVATPEAYLLRRQVRDHDFTQVDRAQVAAELVGDAVGPTFGGAGAGLGFDIDLQLTGDRINRRYRVTDRANCYDALRELATEKLEFTVDLDWADSDRNVVRKIIRLRRRIGVDTAEALFETTASSMFESRAGNEATYTLTEDASSGRYANVVIVTAPGEGDDQPASAPAIDHEALASGVPIVEHVMELSSAARGQAALDAAAQAELARLRHGAQVWEIQARLDAYPRLGVDAQLGDAVSWVLTGHRHPTGVAGTGRMIGYRVDQDSGTWRPILLDPQEV